MRIAPTRIVLADDHGIMREGLRALLEAQDNMQVVGQAENGRRAVQLIRDLRPQVAIIDVTMPDMNGIQATRQAIAEVPEIKVIALSMHADSRAVDQMLKAGALGYVLKDCVFDDLSTAVNSVLADQPYFSPQIANIVLQGYLNPTMRYGSVALTLLSDREREVLQLVAEGNSTKEIAAKLFISIKTVEKHRQQIMEKLEMHSVAELTRFAIREGLISLEG
ncbi:MAG: response regulator [Armatimonadota bacterium]